MYLYYRDGANFWIFSEQILPTAFPPGAGGSGEGILYGHSVGVSLNALAGGAPENNIAADNSGSVFIYDVVEKGCKGPTTRSPVSTLVCIEKCRLVTIMFSV